MKLKPYEEAILNLITDSSNPICAKDIVQSLGVAGSTVFNAINKLEYLKMIAAMGKNDRHVQTYSAIDNDMIAPLVICDGLVLSKYWTGEINMPTGRMRTIRGLIHDDAA